MTTDQKGNPTAEKYQNGGQWGAQLDKCIAERANSQQKAENTMKRSGNDWE